MIVTLATGDRDHQQMHVCHRWQTFNRSSVSH